MAPPRRPRPKISLWARFRTWLRYWESPLPLRSSYIRLSDQHTYPLLALRRMFIPYPTWSFPIPGPYSLRALIQDKQNGTGFIDSHFEYIHNLRAIPIWRARDNPPLRSIYRFYELHLADHYALMDWETEYLFFRPDCKLKDIPDPKDPDPLRYAVIASVAEELHEAVNWRLSVGLRMIVTHGGLSPRKNCLRGQATCRRLIKSCWRRRCHPNHWIIRGIWSLKRMARVITLLDAILSRIQVGSILYRSKLVSESSYLPSSAI